jgi:hypothetical protein
MKIEDIRKDLEKSRKYEEDLDRITARLKEIMKQKSGRISAEEAREIVAHIKRLRLLEGYHQIESFMISEARKEYTRGEKTPQAVRLRAMAHAMNFEDGKKGRKKDPDARRKLFMFNRLRETHSYADTMEILAREFNIRSESKNADPLRTAEKQMERARKEFPDLK